ncbi:hypothetical protein ADUPG1_005841, partial [Aduncisulcus paluster]
GLGDTRKGIKPPYHARFPVSQPGRSRSDDESERESDHPIPMHRMRFPQLHSPRKQSSPFRAAQKNPHSPSASPYRVRMMKKEDSDRHAIGDEVDSSKERS